MEKGKGRGGGRKGGREGGKEEAREGGREGGRERERERKKKRDRTWYSTTLYLKLIFVTSTLAHPQTHVHIKVHNTNMRETTKTPKHCGLVHISESFVRVCI